MPSVLPLILIAAGVALIALSRLAAVPASEFRPYPAGSGNTGRAWLLVAGGIAATAGLALLVSTMTGRA